MQLEIKNLEEIGFSKLYYEGIKEIRIEEPID